MTTAIIISIIIIIIIIFIFIFISDRNTKKEINNSINITLKNLLMKEKSINTITINSAINQLLNKLIPEIVETLNLKLEYKKRKISIDKNIRNVSYEYINEAIDKSESLNENELDILENNLKEIIAAIIINDVYDLYNCLLKSNYDFVTSKSPSKEIFYIQLSELKFIESNNRQILNGNYDEIKEALLDAIKRQYIMNKKD